MCSYLAELLPATWNFRDRKDAGARLAEELERYRRHDVLVLAIRGGVAVAAQVARQVDAGLDIVVARKLGAPSNRSWPLALSLPMADATSMTR